MHFSLIFCDHVTQEQVKKQLLPDSATRSVLLLRPTTVNLDLRRSRVSRGPGMKALAAVLFAVRLSLLPNGIGHHGPPACSNHKEG